MNEGLKEPFWHQTCQHMSFETKYNIIQSTSLAEKNRDGRIVTNQLCASRFAPFSTGESHKTRGEGNFFDDDEEEDLE